MARRLNIHVRPAKGNSAQNSFPRFCVNRPIGAIPAVFMTSMARATTANSTDASPQIKAVRSARNLKISRSRSSRFPRHGFLVDAQGTVRENLYHNYAGFVSPAILRCRGPASLRDLRLEPRGMGEEHKNHQEHQQNVN